MKRTLWFREIRTQGVRPGQVLVAGSYTDPDRGPVRCAAGPLLEMDIHDRIAVEGAVLSLRSGTAVPGSDGSGADAIMFAASYLDRQGKAAGFGVVAHRDCTVGLSIAEGVVRRWAEALRSRRLLVADAAHLCWGGARALETIKSVVRSGPAPVYVVGRPVAGPSAIVELLRTGVTFTDDLDGVPDGARVVFPAHGAGLGVRAQAAARGLEVVDATCPLVAAANLDAAAYAARGDTVVVIGAWGHAAVPMLAEQAGPAGRIVSTPADAEALQVPDAERLSFAAAPGMPVEEVMPIVAALRRRYPGLAGHHFDVLCEAAADRAQTIQAVAGASELTLIVSADADDTDTRAVRRQARRAAHVSGGRVLVLADVSHLRLEDIKTATTIGVIPTLTTPGGLDVQVIQALSGLGPLSIRRRGVRTRPPSMDSTDSPADGVQLGTGQVAAPM